MSSLMRSINSIVKTNNNTKCLAIDEANDCYVTVDKQNLSTALTEISNIVPAQYYSLQYNGTGNIVKGLITSNNVNDLDVNKLNPSGTVGTVLKTI